ncbi:MAG: DUF559 domain-containing protein [Candidatus Omnitrophica bacterium]|nr:DUF559 domain-containing protein [Candidatus Omnitrophota bacterium]
MNEKDLTGRAISLYQYLQQLVRLRTSIVQDVSQYSSIIWCSEIPRDKHCYCGAWELEKEEGDSTWIEIKRPLLPKVPLTPDKCCSWIDASTLEDYEHQPVLREKIIKESAAENELDTIEYSELINFPDIKDAWQEYIEQKWKPWSELYGALKKVHNIYTKLFSMYQQQKALGESYEIVLGLGLLNYKTKEGAIIYRHILSAQTELAFEPKRGTLTIKASPEGANLQFETEMLGFEDQPAAEIQRNLEIAAKEIASDIWQKSKIHPVIKSWVNSFNPNASYDETLNSLMRSNSQEHPEVCFAPAIILRERTKVGILKFVSKIIDQLREGSDKDVPETIRTLITTGEDLGFGNSVKLEIPEEDIQAEIKQDDIYFPLSFNEEQLRIAQYIGNRKGIVVQGPPGTGKSHTIANLVCHLLAQGKRVLITSQAPRALKILKEKIPQQVQSLCVSILGQSQKDFDNLIGAVHEITNMNNAWDKKKSNDRIIKLEGNLLELRKQFQNVKISLTELREKETYKHSIVAGKYTGTAQEIGAMLSTEEDRYGWIDDAIDVNDLPPLSTVEIKKLVILCRKFTKEYRQEILLRIINIKDIFSPEDFVEIVEKEQTYKLREKEIESDITLRIQYDKFKRVDQIKRSDLLTALKLLEKAKADACRRPLPWLNKVVSEILGDQDQPLKLLASSTQEYLKGLKEAALSVDKHNFSIPAEINIQRIKADAEDLIARINSGKNLGWWIFRPSIYKRIKYLTTDILVDGRTCEDINCLRTLLDYINVQISLEKLTELWKDKISIPAGLCTTKVGFFLEQLEALEVVLSIESPLAIAKKMVADLSIINEPSWHDDTGIIKLISVLDSTFVIDRINSIEDKINKISVSLKALSSASDAHQLNIDLLDALEKRDWARWNKIYEKLAAIEKDRQQLESCNTLLKSLGEKAPSLSDFICKNPKDDIIDKCLDDFEKAWDWLRADTWLKNFEESHDEYQLQRDYEDINKKIKKTIAELAAQKAWHCCLDRMDEKQRQNLVAWSLAIKKIGKGTGKHAEKHRREAEEYMTECRTAIPAWVMPLYRVVESFKPTRELFDVVIVDEASQLGPESLALFYIAKKCVIVGDSQQISPEDIGVDPKDVDLLIERFLQEVPLRKTYGLQSSLFDHAKIRYNKSQVFLREHFRCVPEIIQFSNNLCYAPLGTSLIPLRSCSPKRLEPVRTVFIKEGFREGNGQYVVNKPEAEAIVKQIAKCCADPVYKGKSMGIIVLQGHSQNQIIKTMLIETIGVDEIEERNIICGDPYTFQGDERDVIFLCLVAAPNERIGTLAKETDKRRFNVAFSRARDQVWLFHSATLNDLNPNDFRYQLLSYCQNPLTKAVPLGGVDIEDLKKFQENGKRSKSGIPDPFDSWFEVDVFQQIIKQGYRVIPQFKVAEYKIDLVIEGAKSRLAIECDGDEWHGLEQYEQDQWRQRILERAGWRFWRIRGSTFYRDNEQALEPLWQILDELEIYNSLKPQRNISEEIKISESIPEEIEAKIDLVSTETEIADNKDSGNDRLAAAVAYSEKKLIDRNKEIKDIIISLLQESTLGKDLIPDKVLRKMGIVCRGRNRDKLRRRIMRALTDLRGAGIVEEYETDKRKRLKLVNNKEKSLFE